MKPLESVKPGSIWAWVPVMLLAAMFAGLGTLASIAVNDPHFALEPNYYDKAAYWERTQADARESAASGVHAELDELVLANDGSVGLQFRLTDRENQPLTRAQVALQAFPNAYATRVQDLQLREVTPGTYVGHLARGQLGLWELRLSASRGALRFKQVLRQDVSKGDAA